MMIIESKFDSEHYGIMVGKVDSTLLSRPTDEIKAELLQAKRAGFAVLFARVEGTDLRAAEVLPGIGAGKFDTLITSKMEFPPEYKVKPLPEGDGSLGITVEFHDRLTDEDDITQISQIAFDVLEHSHLHHDPRLLIEKTRQLHADWARNDVTGRAKQTILARKSGKVVGFITILIEGSRGVVDLVAVSRSEQRKGIGRLMISKSINWLKENALEATVGTQEDNPALKLYQKAGFKPFRKDDTYHLWLDELNV